VVLGLLVEVLGWDNLLDDLLLDLLAQLLGRDVLAVLCGNDDGVDAERDNGTTIVLVLNGDLGLGIRSQPRQAARVTGLLHGGVELVRQENGEG